MIFEIQFMTNVHFGAKKGRSSFVTNHYSDILAEVIDQNIHKWEFCWREMLQLATMSLRHRPHVD